MFSIEVVAFDPEQLQVAEHDTDNQDCKSARRSGGDGRNNSSKVHVKGDDQINQSIIIIFII